MKKHYEVTVMASGTVYVADVGSKEEAYEAAGDALNTGDFRDLTMTAVELTTKEEQESSYRHADTWSAP